ncbi:MAG TPA: nuclear transport factor 2 family protein [Candidatus Baltobacteraceae bacterium]|jgi:ketosteroid isomerase-like protein|nr:nuclear transport factor 2 family protein [Candidatus Baltobacteraceae bacterium]
MNVRALIVALLALIVLRCNVDAAPYPADMQPYLKPVNTVLAAMANHDEHGFAAAYARDAIIIDTQAPYRWSGSTAPIDWLSALSTFGKLRYARFTALGNPMQVTRDENNAYVTVLGALRGLGAKSGLRQNVLLTFTLREVNGGWKISSQSWTDVPPVFTLSLKS